MSYSKMFAVAIGMPSEDRTAREMIAARLFNFAMRGERDPGKLYLKTFDSYQAVPSVHYVTAVPHEGVKPSRALYRTQLNHHIMVLRRAPTLAASPERA